MLGTTSTCYLAPSLFVPYEEGSAAALACEVDDGDMCRSPNVCYVAGCVCMRELHSLLCEFTGSGDHVVASATPSEHPCWTKRLRESAYSLGSSVFPIGDYDCYLLFHATRAHIQIHALCLFLLLHWCDGTTAPAGSTNQSYSQV